MKRPNSYEHVSRTVFSISYCYGPVRKRSNNPCAPSLQRKGLKHGRICFIFHSPFQLMLTLKCTRKNVAIFGNVTDLFFTAIDMQKKNGPRAFMHHI